MQPLPLSMPEQDTVMINKNHPIGLRRIIPNLLCFQIGWFATVLGAAHGHAWLGPVVIAVNVLIHMRGAQRPMQELQLIFLILLIGLSFETLPALLGWIEYADHSSATAPLWMVVLWANLAITLNVSLRGLRQHTALLALLGLVGAPLAYWGGVSLGASHWTTIWPTLLYIALGWALLTPLLGRLALRLDGYRHDA